MTRKSVRSAARAAVAVCTLAWPGIASADATWINGANNLWSNPNNWSPTGVPAPGSVLHIQGVGGTIMQDLGNGYGVDALTFGSPTTEIAGQSITLSTGATVRSFTFGLPQRISAPVNVPVSATLGGATGNSNDTIRFDDLRGAGNVTIERAVTIFGATYSGTTTIIPTARLWIGGRQGLEFPPPGQTSGQGDYIVNGSLLGRGTIGLASGASVLINNGGLIDGSVGLTIGADLAEFAINGKLVVSTGGNVALDAVPNGATYATDHLIVNGVLDLSAAGDHLFVGGASQFGLFPPSSFVLIDYQTRIGAFDLLNNGTNPNYQITYTSPSGGGPGQIIITTPEPAAAAACGFACVALAQRRRVRSRHA